MLNYKCENMKPSKKNPLIIILLGPQGSGKGTQTELLMKKFGLEYIGSGVLLRARKKKKDFTGIKTGQVIDQGLRIHIPVIFKLWMDKMEEFKKNPQFKGMIIEGSPRTVMEAEMFELALDWYEWHKNKKVIYIDISMKEAVWRLTRRRMCRQCGRIMPFVGKYRAMKKCDQCGGELYTRKDDNEKAIRKRLGWYKKEVIPVINYYKKRGELIKINGEQSIEDAFKDVLKAIK